MGRVTEKTRVTMTGIRERQKVVDDLSFQEITRRQEVDATVLTEWSDFLRKYQHDLQGPLRNIANFLQILKEELTKPEIVDKSATLKCISAAEHCIYTLNSINIEQLLKNHNTADVFDLEKLLEPLYCLLLSQLNDRRCRLDIDSGLPPIIGNKDEILRVFKNLIENSLNHAKTKPPLVITIRKLCQRANRVVLQFYDNGQSLTSKTKQKIKNSFSMPASGISIVKSLLAKNDGYIQFVKSDVGCMWELELPIITKEITKNNRLTVLPKDGHHLENEEDVLSDQMNGVQKDNQGRDITKQRILTKKKHQVFNKLSSKRMSER